MQNGNDVRIRLGLGIKVKVSLRVWIIVVFNRNIAPFPIFYTFCI